MAEAIKVRFNGVDLIWLKDEFGEGALAYPDHVDDTGNIAFQHVMSDSYAHVFSDGTIRRYGQTVGTVKDLDGSALD